MRLIRLVRLVRVATTSPARRRAIWTRWALVTRELVIRELVIRVQTRGQEAKEAKVPKDQAQVPRTLTSHSSIWRREEEVSQAQVMLELEVVHHRQILCN